MASASLGIGLVACIGLCIVCLSLYIGAVYVYGKTPRLQALPKDPPTINEDGLACIEYSIAYKSKPWYGFFIIPVITDNGIEASRIVIKNTLRLYNQNALPRRITIKGGRKVEFTNDTNTIEFVGTGTGVTTFDYQDHVRSNHPTKKDMLEPLNAVHITVT